MEDTIVKDFKSLTKEQRSAMMMLVLSLKKLDLLRKSEEIKRDIKELDKKIKYMSFTGYFVGLGGYK